MKNLFTVALMGLSLTAFAQTKNCTFEYAKEGSTLGWTAFKTPKKAGVPAKFSDFTINAKAASSVKDMLATATFDVNSQSVESGDKARDAKIEQFFFKKMLKGTKITGKVLKTTDTSAEVEMTFNGTTKTITMTSKFDEAKNLLNLKGTINVLDFGMKENLATLTKACFEKHEGVTWPDVEVELNAMVKKTCK